MQGERRCGARGGEGVGGARGEGREGLEEKSSSQGVVELALGEEGDGSDSRTASTTLLMRVRTEPLSATTTSKLSSSSKEPRTQTRTPPRVM